MRHVLAVAVVVVLAGCYASRSEVAKCRALVALARTAADSGLVLSAAPTTDAKECANALADSVVHERAR